MDQISLFEDVSKKVDAIVAEASAEGLNSNIFGRLFVSLSDTLVGVLTTLASNFIRITKSIKRSELHEFIDSNRLRVMTVDGISYDRLIGVNVDCPAKLDGTYKEAIKAVGDVYVKLSTLNLVRVLNSDLTDIFKSITSSDGKTSSLINKISTVINGIMKSAKPAILTCQEKFNGKFSQKVKFETIFKSKEEWNECCTLMRDMEPRLRETKEIHDLVGTMENTLKNVCNYMSDNASKISKQDIVVFGEAIKNAAMILDGYNLAITRHLSLEHNYVLIINEIYRCVR